MAQHEVRIRNGMKTYSLLQQLLTGSTDPAVREAFNNTKQEVGYGLLLKRYTDDITQANEQQIRQATSNSIPRVAPLYFSFRIMVECGVLRLIAACFWNVLR